MNGKDDDDNDSNYTFRFSRHFRDGNARVGVK